MFSVRRAALILACACLAGCTAPSYAPSSHIANVTAGASVSHPSTSGSVEAVTNGQNIYLCQNGICNTCKAPGTGNVGTATTSANPDDAQPAGNVLVANRSHQEIVQFNSVCVETHAPYLDSGYYPNDVGVARSGMIAVTNQYSASYGPGNIKFYPKNANPYVAKGLFEFFYFGAFDARGNFFNDGVDSNGRAGVGVVPVGSRVDRPAGISGVTSPEGMQIARNGTLNIIDLSCTCIRVYKGKSHVGNVTLSGAVKPISLALNQENDRVWVADATTGTVDAYPYPRGGKPIVVLKGFRSAFGVGILPASEP